MVHIGEDGPKHLFARIDVDYVIEHELIRRSALDFCG
jgi:hypothetical protein